MKAQMKFQKILTLVSLVVAALTFVFALSYLSGGLSAIQSYTYDSIRRTIGGVDEFHDLTQSFTGGLVVLSIIFICSVVLLYITSTNSRRKYYITNYVAVGIYLAIGVVVALYILIYLFMLVSGINAIDWDALMAYYNQYGVARRSLMPSKDLTTTILGFVLVVVVLLNLAVWVLNFVWKLKLMKGEKALLEQGLVKEVA